MCVIDAVAALGAVAVCLRGVFGAAVFDTPGARTVEAAAAAGAGDRGDGAEWGDAREDGRGLERLGQQDWREGEAALGPVVVVRGR